MQRVYRSDGSFFDDSSRDPHMIFEPEDGHNHWHLKNAARYSLWNEAKTAEVAPAMKTGFCLIDSQRRETHGPSSAVYTTSGANNFCGQDEPTRTSLFEGVSAGWRDIYTRNARLPVGGREQRAARAATGCAPRSIPTTGRARATR